MATRRSTQSKFNVQVMYNGTWTRYDGGDRYGGLFKESKMAELTNEMTYNEFRAVIGSLAKADGNQFAVRHGANNRTTEDAVRMDDQYAYDIFKRGVLTKEFKPIVYVTRR